MMTFKQFYLQSSKGDKSSSSSPKELQNSKAAARDFGSDCEAKGCQVSVSPHV